MSRLKPIDKLQNTLSKYEGTTYFENWKRGRIIVKREDVYKTKGTKTIKLKGKIITYRKQKGSNIRSRIEAEEIFRKTKTFYKDRWKISGKVYQSKDIESVSKIGSFKDTSQIVSSSPIKGIGVYQYKVDVKWDDTQNKLIDTTTGFSKSSVKLKEKEMKESAFHYAVGKAVAKQIITYDYKQHEITPTRGVYIYGDHRVFYYSVYKVLSYAENEIVKSTRKKGQRVRKNSRI